jgi:PPP family 3-phenylpropionic acid transporter
VIPISEAALAHLVSRGGALDAGRYGGSACGARSVSSSRSASAASCCNGSASTAFRLLLIALLALLFVAALRLPVIAEAAHAEADIGRALAVLKVPVVAWFFAGVFFTVLAHNSLYAFFSLYLDALGYSRTAVGLLWATGVVGRGRVVLVPGRMGEPSLDARLADRRCGRIGLRFAADRRVRRDPDAARALAGPARADVRGPAHRLHRGHQPAFPGRLRGRGQALYTVFGYGIPGVLGGVAGGALSQATASPRCSGPRAGAAGRRALLLARLGARSAVEGTDRARCRRDG